MDQTIANPVGHEITATIKGVDLELLNNPESLKGIAYEALKKEGFTILKAGVHQFGNKSLSIALVLDRSHLCMHTFPEYKTLLVSIYLSKGPREATNIIRSLAKAIPHTDTVISEKRVNLLEKSGIAAKIS